MTHTPQLQPGHDSYPTATARLAKYKIQACRAAPEVDIQFSGQVSEVMTHTPQLQPGLGHDTYPTATARLTKCKSQACLAAPEVDIQFSGQVPEVGALQDHLQGQQALLLIQRVVVRHMASEQAYHTTGEQV